MCEDFLLTLVQLRLNAGGYQHLCLWNTQPFNFIAWAWETDLKISGVGSEEWLVQPVIQHLVAHPAETAAALLNAVEVGQALGEHGIAQDTPAGREQFEQRMEARRLEPGDEESLQGFRRGWYVGSEAFGQEQLARMEGKLGEHHAGELRRERAEAKGERIIAEELQRLGWSESDWVIRPKNDAGKMAIAVRLCRETSLSI